MVWEESARHSCTLILVLATIRRHGRVTLDVTLSGVSSTFLPRDTIAHSLFRTPINVTRDRLYSVVEEGERGSGILKEGVLYTVFWTECTL